MNRQVPYRFGAAEARVLVAQIRSLTGSIAELER
jgi:hypothetical protein